MKRIALVVVAVGLLAVGCKSKPEAAPQPAPSVAAAPPAASASAPAPSASVAPLGKMAHCPSTVAGAKTAIADSPTGIEITVTSPDAAATQEIRARAAFLVTSSKNDDAQQVVHNGSGEGGGIFGRCPVVMRNTTLVATDVDGGSKLAVAPRDAKERDWLRRESRARNDELAMPGSEGAGINKMAHCPNAVTGAVTTIADQKDAVTITVTAKDEAAVKEIRDRALKIVAAAKGPNNPTPAHDGTGNGGGGFGRCPVVLADTEVAAKDAPAGTVITVKPKKGGDLKALDKEIRDRSAKFATL